MKRLSFLIFLMLILATAVSALEYEKAITPTTPLELIHKNFGTDFYNIQLRAYNNIPEKIVSGFQPASQINSVDSVFLKNTIFEDTIYVSDALGNPKYEFKSNEHIYLKDNRIAYAPEFHFPKYESEPYANMYVPNSAVDIYILFDIPFYEDFLPYFRILRSSTNDDLSRGKITRKTRVYTDSEGRIPFTDLGTIGDIMGEDVLPGSFDTNRLDGLHDRGAAKGRHGTYDYSSQPGNRLRDTEGYAGRINFDIFIDADTNGIFNVRGPAYRVPGKGGRVTDGDYYLWPESPGFAVEMRERIDDRGCCRCARTTKKIVGVNDVFQCSQYCEGISEDLSGYAGPTCEETIIEKVKSPTTILRGLQFYSADVPNEFLKRYFFQRQQRTAEKPSSPGIAYAKQGEITHYLKDFRGEYLFIDADIIEYNPSTKQLLLTTSRSEIFIYDVLEDDNILYVRPLHYVERIHDMLIAESDNVRFHSPPASATLQNNGNVILRDQRGDKYTLKFQEFRKGVSQLQEELSIVIAEFADINVDAKVKRVAILQDGIATALRDKTNNIIELSPINVYYDPNSQTLAIISHIGQIYIFSIHKSDEGRIFGIEERVIETPLDKSINLAGEGSFIGGFSDIRLGDGSTLVVYDEENKQFTVSELVPAQSIVTLIAGDDIIAELEIIKEEIDEIIIKEIIEEEEMEDEKVEFFVSTEQKLLTAAIIVVILGICFAGAYLIHEHHRRRSR